MRKATGVALSALPHLFLFVPLNYGGPFGLLALATVERNVGFFVVAVNTCDSCLLIKGVNT